MHRKEDQTPAREDKKDRRNNLVIPYVAGVSEKLRRVFSKHNIPVYFRPSNTLRQKLVHPKDKTLKHKLNNVVYAVQCSEECPDLYIGETKQPLHKRMAQHRRATSTGQD
uniref:GIY-YIG domain-containing protein n=1 Tax=Nothobranchius kadleci TaxID=1051664 RepID=A0A1A8DK57_NOTKA